MKKGAELTGYPSIDKPWLKYYNEDAINTTLPEMTMYEYVWENNKNDLSDIAFSYFGTKITYGDFFENVKKAACSFAAMGVKKDDIVTIMSMHTPETFYAFYGLNYVGAVANMVYMTLSENEIINTLNNTQSKLFLVLDSALEKVNTIKSKIDVPIIMLSVADSMLPSMKSSYYLKKQKPFGYMNWNTFLNEGESVILPTMARDHASMATIVYTSGTTGEPKGVMLSDDDINILVFQDTNGLVKLERKDTVLLILPPFIAFGITHLHMLASSGLEIILQIEIEPQIVAESFYRYTPNIIIVAPSYVDAIMDPKYQTRDLTNLKYFFSGGGEIVEKKELAFNDFLKRNNALAITLNCNDISKISSAGIPILRTTVKVINLETGNECKYGEKGELYFHTPNLMIGYYHNKIATEEIVCIDEEGNRWIKTGDLGYVDEDGFVYITGRIKRIFFTRGDDGFSYKLFPQRIEELIQSHNNVENCGVIIIEDDKRINISVAFVTTKDKTIERKKLCTDLFRITRQELPEHEQPVDIIVIDKMPLTPSGKIDYRTLESMVERNRKI